MQDKKRFDPIIEKDLEKRKQFEELSKDEQVGEVAALHEYVWFEKGMGFREKAELETDEKNKERLLLTLDIVEAVRQAGGLGLVLGGYVRDEVMRRLGSDVKTKDLDIEVYGLGFEDLKSLLQSFGELDVVGDSYKVIKLLGIDISVTRRDSKTGKGHKGITADGDPTMTIKEAGRRRDFTINAMALDPNTGEIIDPYGGIGDIQKKVLRIIDPVLFAEDPVRPLRAMQFAGRFGFNIDPETVEVCRSVDLSELKVDRIGEEWHKLLLQSPKPSIGLEAARALGILEKLHPEMAALFGVPQDSEWHPEGDVWIHTKMVVDCAAEIVRRENLPEDEASLIMLASLCHDLGKPATTKTNEKNRIASKGHSEAGIEPAKSFLKLLFVSQDKIKKIEKLIQEHLFPAMNENPSDKAVRRLAERLHPATIQELVWVSEADQHGRTLPWHGFPAGEALLRKAEELSVKEAKLEPIVQGRDLLDLGFKPGPRVGQIVSKLFELQLDGKISSLEQGKRLVPLFNFLIEAENRDRDIPPAKLLNGEWLTRDELGILIEERFLDQGTHDMGTLTASLLLAGKELPPEIQRNLSAILTAHQYGPIWLTKLDRDFYDNGWKSFYGKFEVAEDLQKEMEQLSYAEQEKEALELIARPNRELIGLYEETFNIKPVMSEGRFGLYVTDQYPFEAGLIDGLRVMVQYVPSKKRMAISILDEGTKKVHELDAKVRQLLPEFAQAKKIGYLHAADKEGEDNVFSEEDAKRVYEVLKNELHS